MILTNFGSIPSSGGSLWLEGWSYGKKITIPANSIDADLTDFPATVYLNSSNFDFSKTKQDGSDIRFTDKNLSLLKYERKEHRADQTYMYKAGDEFSALTGGWVNYTGQYSGALATKNATSITLYSKNSVQISAITNDKPIDLTPYTTLKVVVDVVAYRGAEMVQVNANKNSITGIAVPTVFATGLGKQTLTVNVSSLSGFYYILPRCDGTDTVASSMIVENIILENGSAPFVGGGAVYNVLVPTVSDLTDTEIYMWYGNANAYNTSIEAWQDQTGKQLTYNGNVKLVHGVQTGKRVASFDGSGDYFTVPYSPDLNLVSGDYTIEAYVYPRTFIENHPILQMGYHQGGYVFYDIVMDSAGKAEIRLYNGSSYLFGFKSTNSLTLNGWNHVAVTRTGNIVSLFVNGIATTTSYTGTTVFPSDLLKIGWYADGAGNTYLYGYIHIIRVTKGRSRYGTSNFTPPTSFTIDGSDVVFCTNFDTIYDTNYAMVQHMGDTLVDASGNGNNGTATGTTVVNTDYGKARSFNGSSFIALPSDGTALATGYTISSLISTTVATGQRQIITREVSNGYTYNNYEFQLADRRIRLVGVAGWGFTGDTDVPIDDVPFYAGARTETATQGRIFYNGLDNSGLDTSNSGWNTTGGQVAFIGKRPDNLMYYNGKIYELRLSNTQRSNAWIKAESLALKNSLITVSDV